MGTQPSGTVWAATTSTPCICRNQRGSTPPGNAFLKRSRFNFTLAALSPTWSPKFKLWNGTSLIPFERRVVNARIRGRPMSAGITSIGRGVTEADWCRVRAALTKAAAGLRVKGFQIGSAGPLQDDQTPGFVRATPVEKRCEALFVVLYLQPRGA